MKSSAPQNPWNNPPNKKERHYWLYALKLEQGKYYVGVTSKTPEARYKEHANGSGAEWTKLYKPTKIIQTVDLGDTTYEKAEAYENKVTRRYIKEYGFNNVRGGDINFRGKYLRIFGYYYHDKSWQETTDVIGLVVLVIVFGLYTVTDLIFDKKIFGPWH